MLVWSTPYKGHSRVKMLLEDEQYLVVLERREKYCLLITAFYVDQEHRLEKLRKEFDKVSREAGSSPERDATRYSFYTYESVDELSRL